MFKVVTIDSNGTREEDDEVFETEAEAEQHGQQMCSDDSQGAEVLHMHNPGDYPDPDDEIDYVVIEVDDGDWIPVSRRCVQRVVARQTRADRRAAQLGGSAFESIATPPPLIGHRRRSGSVR